MNVLQTTPTSPVAMLNCKFSEVLKLRAILAGFNLQTEIVVDDNRTRQMTPYDNYYLDQSPTTMGNFYLKVTGDSEQPHNVAQFLDILANASTPMDKLTRIWLEFRPGPAFPEMWFFTIQEFRDAVNEIIAKKFN